MLWHPDITIQLGLQTDYLANDFLDRVQPS